jgi:UTP-glucose-1-phosphate uridylyltransferase
LRASGDVFLAFADNLYPHDSPSLALAAVPAGQTAVLVRPYNPAEANHRGVIVSGRNRTDLVLTDLIEKPSQERAQELEDAHGMSSLWLLEGRTRLTRGFVDQLRHTPMSSGAEPKLSLAIRWYAANSGPVHLVVTHSAVTDLGNSSLDRPPADAALAG